MTNSRGQPDPTLLKSLQNRFGALRHFTKIELRIITVWGIPIALAVGVLLGWTAANTGKPGDALDILSGSGSAFQDHAGVAGVALAIIGYLLVPAIIGAVVAAVLAARADSLLPSQELVEENFEKKLVGQTRDEVMRELVQMGVVKAQDVERPHEP